MPNPDIERLTAEAVDLVRRAIEIGIRMERIRVRGRLLDLLAVDAEVVHEIDELLPATSMPRARPRRTRGIASGGPIALVRKALAEMPIGEHGVDAAELLTYLKTANPDSGMTDKRVRGALKQLWNIGEATRASRGRYIPRAAAVPLASQEKSGEDESPDPFQLAAE